METLHKLFGSLLGLVSHCFDPIVILGYVPLLTRPENVVHFFRDVQGIRAITKEVLHTRIDDDHRWVESFARSHQIPIEWAEQGVRKEHSVLPFLQRMERRHRFGVFLIVKSMEQGPSFRRTTGLPDPEPAAVPLHTLAAVTDRFAAFEAEALDVHVDFPLFQRLARPIPCGRTKIPGIKIHDTRLLRVMEVLLQGGPRS